MPNTIFNGNGLVLEGAPPIRTLVLPHGYIALAKLNVVASAHKNPNNTQMFVSIYERPIAPEIVGSVLDTYLCAPTQEAFLDVLVQNLPKWVRAIK